jgi:uncharacterized XkdX family phage protein
MSEKNKVKYQKRYEKGGCTIEQLKRLVELGALTASEYTEITGEHYYKY